MKKILVVFVVVLLLCTLCSCGVNNNATEETETQLHKLVTPKAESSVEWCKIDADVSLSDSDTGKIITKDDFDSFALLGADDKSSYLEIKLTNSGKEIMTMMYETLANKEISFNIGDEEICKLTFDESVKNGDFIIGQALSYETLCNVSSKLRGLS